MKQLYELLEEYNDKNIYPFHMPGHKRNTDNTWLTDAYQMDITEIEGFDNLHHAQDILKTAQEQAAKLYQSEETHFLVNGSTCGILSAISASVQVGGRILIARNCHKSVYNAVKLRQLQANYIYPKIMDEALFGGISPDDIEIALQKDMTIEAVMITSPTMDGIVSDVEKIAQICHRYGKVLIVDEAHGAHFGMHEMFPQNAIKGGADIVIHSLHKTLPSFTQTALLHVNGTRADRKAIREFLAIYQTSSPSYLLMGSMDYCIHRLTTEKDSLFSDMQKKISIFKNKVRKLRNIRILSEELIGNYAIKDLDEGKLIISVKNTNMSGKEIYDILYHRYKIQLEMAAADYVLAIITINDTIEGYERLAHALLSIDKEMKTKESNDTPNASRETMFPKAQYSIYKAGLAKTKKVSIADCMGGISAEFVYLYPPGVPILVPGEIITEHIRNQILYYKQQGLSLQGMEDIDCNRISIIQ